jgi:predicted TIM-barrel fold metal-dependent hydrolase
LLAIAAAGSASAQQCPALIDVHLHAYERDARFRLRVPNAATGQPSAAVDGPSHRRLTLEQAKAADMVRGIVSGDDKAAVEAMIAQDPARFKRGFEFEVPTAKDYADLRALAKAGKLAMIGEIAPQYEGVAPTDPRLEPLWALAEEFDLPVGYHMGNGPPDIVRKGSPNHRVALGNPLLIEEVLAKHPKLRLYIMHAGFPFGDGIEALLSAYSNVYVDISAIDWAVPKATFYAHLKRLIDGGFGDRIMFGSDQMTWPEAIGIARQAYLDAPFLTEAQRRAIFYDNAVRFFRWTDLPKC